MKKIIIILLFVITIILPSKIEAKLNWQQSFGGNYYDYVNNHILTKNDDMIFLGTMETSNVENGINEINHDLYITRYDSKGNLLWQQSWGGNNDEQLKGAVESNDNILVYGYSPSTDIEGLSNKGNEDALILKYDKNGNLLWQQTWGGNGYESCQELIVNQTEKIICAGDSYSTDIEGISNKGISDIFIVEYDKDGNLLWQQTWGGNKEDYLKKIIKLEDDSIIIYAITNSTDIPGRISLENNYDIVILKYDKDGKLLWQKIYGGNGEEEFQKISIINDSIIAGGTTTSTNIEGINNKGIKDIILVKFDLNGNILWQKSWGGNDYDYFTNMYLTDEDILIVGNYNSTDITTCNTTDDSDVIILKYDQNGNLTKEINWCGNGYERFTDIKQDNEKNFILWGCSSSTNIEGLQNIGGYDAVIVKYDQEWNLIMQKNFGDQEFNEFSNLMIAKDNSIIATTNIYGTISKNSREDILILKYSKDGDLQWIDNYGGNNNDMITNSFLNSKDEVIVYFSTLSTDIENLENKGFTDVVIANFKTNYIISILNNNIHGSITATQQGSKGIITPTPDKGYKVEKVIVKDTTGKEIETKLEQDGTYSFDLYDDVTIEVLFALAVDNPKTGILNYGAILTVFIILPILALMYICRYNQKYGL